MTALNYRLTWGSGKIARNLLLGVIATVVALLAAISPDGGGKVSADNGPHVQGADVTTDSCAACHRAHTGQAANILKTDQGPLCLTCHDGFGADTNVVDGVWQATGDCLRAGGFTNAKIDAGAGYNTTGKKHRIDCTTAEPVASMHEYGASGTIWGFGSIDAAPNPGQASYLLECGSCHDPHGNGNYRILRIPPTSVTPATPLPSMADESKPDYTIDDYWRPTYAESSSPVREMTKWCSQCHSRHRALTGSGSSDSGDAIFAYRHRGGGGTATVTQSCDNCHTSGKTVTLSCAKCHVAHGSNATVAGEATTVPYPGGGTGNEGSSLLRMDNRGVCQRCHGK